MDNITIANRLREHARLLDCEKGNLMRVRAYRQAAQMIRDLETPLTLVLEHDGVRGLRALPRIGRRIAVAIESLIRRGTIPDRSNVPAA